MNENVNQPEQASPTGADSPNEFTVYGYEEPPVPYLPLPSESPQQLAGQTNPAPVADSQATDPSPSSSSPGDTAAAPPRQGSGKLRIALLLSFLFDGLVLVIWAIYHLIIWGVLLLGFIALVLVCVVTMTYNKSWSRAIFFALIFSELSFVIVSVPVIVMLKTLNRPGLSVLLLMPLSGGLLLATVLINEAYVERILKRNGVTIEGYITGHRKEAGPRGGTYYHLIYSYEYNEMAYSLEKTVKKDIYNALKNGDGVDVRCLPEHPMIARLYDPKLNKFISG